MHQITVAVLVLLWLITDIHVAVGTCMACAIDVYKRQARDIGDQCPGGDSGGETPVPGKRQGPQMPHPVHGLL